MMQSSFHPNWFSAPGATIKDIMSIREIDRLSLASQLESTLNALDDILEGGKPINTELADKLESVFDIPASFWLKRDKLYQIRKPLETIEEGWINSIPKAYIGLKNIRDKKIIRKKAFDFFGISSVQEWSENWGTVIAGTSFRLAEAFQSDFLATAAWLRKGDIIVSDTPPILKFDLGRLEDSLVEIKACSRLGRPEIFIPRVTKALSYAGVRLIVVQAPRGCTAYGAARLHQNNGLIQLSMRQLSDDHFWFALFHEIGHLLLHSDFLKEGGEQPFVDSKLTRHDDSKEQQANSFAADWLVPRSLRNRLQQIKGKRMIFNMAQEASTSAGVVVGQMQFEGIISQSSLNGYKRRYSWDKISEIEGVYPSNLL